MLRLHYEILDFYHFIQLNNEEIELRNKTFKDIKDIIEENFPDYTCELFGSFKTGLSLPNSDIDILVLQKEVIMEDNNSDINNENKLDKELFKSLKKIYNIFLEKKNEFNSLEMINAKVPIIKCIYKKTNIRIDISLFRENGALAVKEIDKLTKIYPEIKPLMLVIKYALRQRDLNEIYKGGVSSFIIFTLLYYYLTDVKKTIIHKIKKDKKEEKLETLGHLLIGFFTFYGYDFNYKKLKISIRNGCFLIERKDEGKNILSVENYQDISQDMGKNCFQYKRIIEFFKFARDSLLSHDLKVESSLKSFIFPDDLLRERALKYK
jgi:non-canonical poly(A) RNA polymerase PAPD5/7